MGKTKKRYIKTIAFSVLVNDVFIELDFYIVLSLEFFSLK